MYIKHPVRKQWDDLKTDINNAQILLSKEKLTEEDAAQVIILRGRIQDGVQLIRSFDYVASAKNASNDLLARALNAAMLSTAEKGEKILSETATINNWNWITAAKGFTTLAGLAAIVRYEWLGKSVLPVSGLLTAPAPMCNHPLNMRLVQYLPPAWYPFWVYGVAAGLSALVINKEVQRFRSEKQ